MKKFFAVVFFSMTIAFSCGGNIGNIGDTGNTGDTGDSGNTGGELPDNGDSGDTGDTGDTSNTGDTGNSSAPDDDNDGIPNSVEGDGDTDEDGTPDYLDTDSDNDGINDDVETPNGVTVDTDEDGTPDYKDSDSDGDGIPDSVEGVEDADTDGVPNYRDTDSDGDSIPDQIECPEQPCLDSDKDGTPDCLDEDSDDDGIKDIYEGVNDPDKDGIPNFLDDDSDGDTILDIDENDGSTPPLDTDDDDVADFLDYDSDNDGLTDKKEMEIGTDPTLADSDGDGFDDNTEYAAGSNPIVSDPEWWDGKYYVTLPYNDTDHEIRPLDFSTDITKADILFLIDLSGSMDGEIANLKSGINNTLIGSIKSKIPDVGFGIATFEDYDDYPDKGTRITQFITTNENTIKSTVNGTNTRSGGWEPHLNALYYAANGAPHGNVAAINCSGKEGSIGGACYRAGALPIMIMMSDEAFVTHYNQVTSAQTNTAMNSVNAKFIGVDSSSSKVLKTNYNTISQGTGSVDGSGNQFYYSISTNGSGLSDNIASGVEYLVANVPMLVNTSRESITNPQLVDVTQFIKSVTPIKKVLSDMTEISCPTECTTEAFQNVKPGTTVTFDIDFYNDFYEPTTTETTVFRAKINVLGEGSFLDDREVYIIVPGKEVTGPGN